MDDVDHIIEARGPCEGNATGRFKVRTMLLNRIPALVHQSPNILNVWVILPHSNPQLRELLKDITEPDGSLSMVSRLPQFS